VRRGARALDRKVRTKLLAKYKVRTKESHISFILLSLPAYSNEGLLILFTPDPRFVNLNDRVKTPEGLNVQNLPHMIEPNQLHLNYYTM